VVLRGFAGATHKVKERAKSAGGPQALKQKGTGRARVGSIRSPLCVMAARSTDQGRAITATRCRENAAGALRSALSAKLAEQKLTVVDAWTLETQDQMLLAVLAS